MTDPAEEITAALGQYLDETDSPQSCGLCGGEGWYIGHEDRCYDTGDCSCGGTKVHCSECDA